MIKKAIPTGRILRGIRSRKWSIAEALAELVDNSFGELRGKADTVTIQWDPKKRILFILDNGRGMKDVADLFTLGEGTTSGAGDIGVFGMGGSEALLWLADHAIVQTLQADWAGGRVACGRANWASCIARNDFPLIDNQWRRATPATCTTELLEREHGTLIILRLHQGLRVIPEKIRDQLSRRYGVGLRTGRRIEWVDGVGDDAVVTPIQAWNPGEMKDVITATITLDNGLAAQVLAGRVEGLSVRNSKLAVNYLYRQIKETTEGFGKIVQGAVGYVDLSSEWLQCLTTTKDDIREDCRELEAKLMAEIAQVLRPLIDGLEKEKLRKVFNNVKFNLKRRLEFGIQQASAAEEDPTGEESESGGPSPDLSGGSGNHFDGPGYQRPRKRRSTEKVAAQIDIVHQSEEEMEGLLCKVEITKETNQATAFVNVDYYLVKEALNSEPINQLLLEQILINALANEIVKVKVVEKFGLLVKQDLEALMDKFGGNELDLVLYLVRVLTDGLVKEGVPA